MSQRRTSALVVLLCLAIWNVATAQLKPQRVRASQGVMENLLTNKVQPEYPGDARRDRIQGVVVLKVIIGKEGNVENIELMSGHPMLAPAAISAVKQWKYKPYLLNGEPVEVDTQVTVNFTLADKPASESSSGTPSSSPGPSGGVIGSAPSSPPSNAAGTPQRIRVSAGVESGLLLTKVQPEYPEEARKQHIQGVVSLQATIDKEGNVAHLELISGHPLLAPAALDAVKQWKYKPYPLGGTPLQVETQIQVNFTLQE